MRRVILGVSGALVLAACIAAYVWWVRGAGVTRYVTPTHPVSNVTIIAMIDETGTIEPRNKVMIKSEVNGRVEAVYVEDGARVTAGCVLVQLDRTDLLNRRRELELERRETLLNLETADLDFARNRELFERKLVSPDVYDKMRIQRELKSNSVARIDRQIVTVDDNLRKSTILAPMHGTVLNRSIEVGEVVIGASSVSSGTEMMQVADLDVLEVRMRVNEVDVGSLHTGMPVVVTADGAAGLVFTGRVDRIAPAASVASLQTKQEATSTQGFEVHVLLEGLMQHLRPGMTANLAVSLACVSNVLGVPLAAVFCDDYDAAPVNQRFYVFVKSSTNFVKQPVWVGVQNTQFVHVISGVTEKAVVALERPAADGAAPRVHGKDDF